jgi:integrase
MVIVVVRYKTTATARWALLFIVRGFFNDTITVAVWTGFHVRLMGMLPQPRDCIRWCFANPAIAARPHDVRAEHGDKPVALLTREHVKVMLAQKVATRAAANHWLRLVKALMAFAVEEKWRSDDPTIGIKRIKNKSDGFHTWDENEIAVFEARHPVGSKARLALALLLYTAQRRSDVVRMGRQHIRNGVAHVRQQKTGAMLAIPLHPALAAIIEATPSNRLTFLTTSFGKPFTAPGFGNWFRERCNEANLPRHCAAH